MFVLPAPDSVSKDGIGASLNVLDKLGPRSALTIVFLMILLLARLFWLVIQFGRRLSGRTYLGPLARDALARAEIARRYDDLDEDFRRGNIEPDLKPEEDGFKNLYKIPLDAHPPNLSPSVTFDWRYEEGPDPWYQSGLGGLGGGGPGRERESVEDWSAEQIDKALADIREIKNDNDLRDIIRWEIEKRFRNGYRAELLKKRQKERTKIKKQERDRAAKLLPTIDVSAFGGGWIFILEFTTIIFIVFAALALGFVGVLQAEQIGTILAAIAGYVLGKSTSIRGSGGEEVRRGAEEPKALMEAISKQQETRLQSLQKELEEYKKKESTRTKITVPDVKGLDRQEAENKIKERYLVAEIKAVENVTQEANKVFDQSPAANSEVEKGSKIVLLVAVKPQPVNKS